MTSSSDGSFLLAVPKGESEQVQLHFEKTGYAPVDRFTKVPNERFNVVMPSGSLEDPTAIARLLLPYPMISLMSDTYLPVDFIAGSTGISDLQVDITGFPSFVKDVTVLDGPAALSSKKYTVFNFGKGTLSAGTLRIIIGSLSSNEIHSGTIAFIKIRTPKNVVATNWERCEF